MMTLYIDEQLHRLSLQNHLKIGIGVHTTQNGYLCLDGSTLRSSTGDVGILVTSCIILIEMRFSITTNAITSYFARIRFRAHRTRKSKRLAFLRSLQKETIRLRCRLFEFSSETFLHSQVLFLFICTARSLTPIWHDNSG